MSATEKRLVDVMELLRALSSDLTFNEWLKEKSPEELRLQILHLVQAERSAADRRQMPRQIIRGKIAMHALSGYLASFSGPDVSSPPAVKAADWAVAYADKLMERLEQ